MFGFLCSAVAGQMKNTGQWFVPALIHPCRVSCGRLLCLHISKSFKEYSHTHTHTHTHTHSPVTPVLMVEQSAVDNNMITLTCTAIAYPQPFQNYVRWERVSDGIPLDTTQIFTETDIDFTVTITADVDVSTCEPEGYRCVVNNTRGTTKRSVTLCSGGCGSNALIFLSL